jgi:uncharacterized membrane protein
MLFNYFFYIKLNFLFQRFMDKKSVIIKVSVSFLVSLNLIYFVMDFEQYLIIKFHYFMRGFLFLELI